MHKYQAVMAERLRRWTRNPMGSSRAGSNPARSGRLYFTMHYSIDKRSSLFEISPKYHKIALKMTTLPL